MCESLGKKANKKSHDDINKYRQFKSWYIKIIKTLNFDEKEDKRARDILLNILKKKDPNWNSQLILQLFKQEIHQKPSILIYGCGPSLEQSIEKILKRRRPDFFEKFINLAADGASRLLSEKNIPVNGIFSDLDGITKKEFEYGNFVIIHAHGDNIEKLRQFRSNIIAKENIICTTQVEPINGILNPGGFTDGDRILYFIKNLVLPHQKIFLFGMDFHDIVGKFSKPSLNKDSNASVIKKQKLRLAIALIEDLLKDFDYEVYFVNSEKSSQQFQYLSLSSFFRFYDKEGVY